MLYVGLDIHSKFIAVCVLNGQGQVILRCKVRQVDQLVRVLRSLSGPFEVCYEASCGYGRFYELLAPLAARVVVAHPGLLKLIFRSKHKTDARDAEQLAKLLFVGQVPAVHVPSAQIRDWRELITFRRRLVEKRTRAKNGVRALLRSQGITPPARPGLWTQAGGDWLRQLQFSSPLHALKRDLLLDEIRHLSQQVLSVERQLNRIAEQSPAVTILRTIPGVGPRTAEAVAAFLDDPQRFAHSKQVGAYFGLVPSQDQSGSRDRKGRITHEGSATVRHVLVEAAWQAVRRSATVRGYFERLMRGDPARKKIALVGTAHYLARVMWSMLRRQTLWRETQQPTTAAV